MADTERSSKKPARAGKAGRGDAKAGTKAAPKRAPKPQDAALRAAARPPVQALRGAPAPADETRARDTRDLHHAAPRPAIAAEPAAQPPRITSLAVTADERRRMIAETAYYKAARRGFRGGDPASDWLEAEAEIDAKLMGEAARRPR
jgi:hypothetical protein